MFGNLFRNGIMHTFVHIGYFSGLTALAPVFSTSWRTGAAPWTVFSPTFWIASGVILLCFIVLMILKNSIGAGLRSVGMLTMIPGFISLLFGIVSQESVFNFLNAKISAFAVVEPTIHFLVEHAVPKMVFIALIYIVLGYVIYRIGWRLSRF